MHSEWAQLRGHLTEKEAKMKELGLDMADDKGYDLHNEENIHNAVTDAEASKPNQPRQITHQGKTN